MDEFDSRVTDLLEMLLDKAEKLYPQISFSEIGWRDTVKGQIAGKAYLESDVIELNRSIPSEGLEQTVTHEFCHLVAWKVFKDRGHGKKWKEVMVAFNQDPKRCHDYDLPSARRERMWDYMCPACGSRIKVPTRKHNKMQNKGYGGKCKVCGAYVNGMCFDQILTGETV